MTIVLPLLSVLLPLILPLTSIRKAADPDGLTAPVSVVFDEMKMVTPVFAPILIAADLSPFTVTQMRALFEFAGRVYELLLDNVMVHCPKTWLVQKTTNASVRKNSFEESINLMPLPSVLLFENDAIRFFNRVIDILSAQNIKSLII
jgi:hypothetical protein